VITTPPIIADLKNDGSLEVLVLTNRGNIICLKGNSGKLIWNYKLPSPIKWGTTSLAVSDLQNNGVKEIIAADNAGNLFSLKEDGTVLWSKKFEDKFNTSPAIGQLNENGDKNILIGSNLSPLICFSSKGKELWRVSDEKSSGSSPLICDIDGDNIPEILVGTGTEFTLFNNSGKKLWSYKMRGEIHDAISFGDLNDDNNMEIIVVDLLGDVVALNNMGKVLWKANVVQRVRRSATIADIDGDFIPEILIAGYSSVLFVFNNDGSLKNQIPLKGAMNGSPSIVDFKGDGNLSVVCGASSEIVAFSWTNQNQNSSHAIPFAEYRVNSLRTGSIIKKNNEMENANMKVDFGDFYVGENVFKVIVHNPHKKQLKLKLKLNKNGIENDKDIGSSDTLFSEKIFYNIYGNSALNLEFSAKLLDNGKLIMQKNYSSYIIPFAKDIADFKKKLAEIKAINSDYFKSNQHTTDRLILYSHRMHEIEEKIDEAGTLPLLELSELKNSVSLLRKEINAFHTMTKVGQDAKYDIAVYSANPWAPFGGIDEIMENRLQKANVSIEAFMGETESAAINIANFMSKAITLRIEALSLISSQDSTEVLAKDVIEFHEVLNIPTQKLDYSADALPLLNQAQTMLIPNWDVRQLWINVNTKSLTPGTWKTIIQLRSLEVESKQIDIPVTIKVWKGALPKIQPVSLCHWGYIHTSRLKNYPDEAFADQVSHGTNVFVATNTFAPEAEFDSEGNIVGKLDYREHDEYVHKHVKDGVILFVGYQGKLKGPVKQFTPVWNKAYKIWLKAWIEHLKNMGVTYDQYAFYPVDEPGLSPEHVTRFIAHGKLIREADPKAQIYTDPVGRATMDDLKNMNPYVDIWCPNRTGFLLNEGQDKLAYLKSTGKTLWTYECIGNAKHLSPIGYYRSQAWLVWHHALTGMGFWSYSTSSADPWFVPEGTLDYLLVYQGKGVVSSKRWEAIRDGIEDYGILNELKHAANLSKDNSDLKLLEEVHTLLKDDVFEIARYCGLDEYGMEPGIGGMKELRQIEDARWENIKEVRRKIAQLLDALN
ncbi:MAG: PQQ-binding-like beta-propeller repeat protein, partial [Bacteroidales bacterium]|nr:PQQ-binding-like beta-propeller repeat protein [Bacteroidales bacterium]